MNRNAKNPVLKTILTKAVKAYDDNGVLADYIENPDIDSGSEMDSLAAFIVREASDVFDTEADEAANSAEIALALTRAIAQLQAVREAIYPDLHQLPEG
jgi:hypothetical protein